MIEIYIGLAISLILASAILFFLMGQNKARKARGKLRNQHKQTLLQIIEAGGANVADNNGNTPAILAVRYGFVDVLDVLLTATADLNAADHNGNTALHFAAALNNVDAMRKLVNHGANLNARSQQGFSPAMVAVKAHTLDALRFLIEAKADVLHAQPAADSLAAYARSQWAEAQTNQQKDKERSTLIGQIEALAREQSVAQN